MAGQSESFADMAVFDPVSVTLTSADEAERISVARISPNFFPLLGVQPLQGRIFSAEEAEQRQRLALISHRFWQTRFGGSHDAIGASIELDGLPSLIIGILPAGFQFASLDADVWEPHTMFPDWETRRGVRGAGSWFVVGRLRPNVTFDQAQAEMSAIARRLDEQVPADGNRGISVVPLSLHVIGPRPRLALWMLTGAVSCVLLIAAANVASLSLARSVGRAREMAIRAALGASPVRIVRQFLAESVTLAAISGLLGALLALAGIRFIRALEPGDLARLNEVSLDLRVLGWALALSCLTGILVGLAPAITMVRRNVRPSGEEGGRGVAGGVVDAPNPPRSRGGGICAGDHSAGRRRSPDPKLAARRERRSGIQAGAGPFDAALHVRPSGPPRSGPTFYNRVLEQIESTPRRGERRHHRRSFHRRQPGTDPHHRRGGPNHFRAPAVPKRRGQRRILYDPRDSLAPRALLFSRGRA